MCPRLGSDTHSAVMRFLRHVLWYPQTVRSRNGSHSLVPGLLSVNFNRRCKSGRLTAPRSAQLPSFHPRLAVRMGSKSSKPKRLASTKAGVGVTPRIPQDIIDEILDHLVTDSGAGHLRKCALISKSWVPSCRRHLFHTVTFTTASVREWFKTFPLPEESPAHHVRDLRVWIGGGNRVPEKFFEYTVWFANAGKISLLGHGGFPLLRSPSLWRFPQHVTSLTIDTSTVTLVHVRDIMAQLPNLDDLSLLGFLIPVGESVLPGIGATVRGRFGGQLTLRGGYTRKETMNMLLEIPSGLHFTEVEISCMRDRLPSVLRLIEACSKTLVKLSYKVPSNCKSRPLLSVQLFCCAGCRC